MKRVVIPFLVALMVVSAFLYLFRGDHAKTEIGDVRVKHRWGVPYQLSADVNFDGVINYIEKVSAPFGEYSNHTSSPLEIWEDRDGDGVFELHFLMKDGELSGLEIDDDADGSYDRILEPTEASFFLKGDA